jgi:CRISPR/Cas system-associated protein Cas5 (RAMP superfamily)
VQDNKRFEVQYIVDSINKQNKIENTTHDYKLHINDQVTLIELKKTLKKTRYNASPYYYVITESQANQLQLSPMMVLLKQLLDRKLFLLIHQQKQMKLKSI